jgi:hypothetical protein
MSPPECREGEDKMSSSAIFVMVMMAVLWFPVSVWAAETMTASGPAADQHAASAQPGAKSASSSPPKAGKEEKSGQQGVQSRGIFQKKKKKQVGGSAGHSQPSPASEGVGSGN